jgi:Nickel responsive protein SCO4226-like
MARFVVERTFPEGLAIPVDDQGAGVCLQVIGNNSVDGVTWVHSYVTEDKSKTFCIYDAPSPEAIRTAASRNNLPVDRISEVRVLDPYFYL